MASPVVNAVKGEAHDWGYIKSVLTNLEGDQDDPQEDRGEDSLDWTSVSDTEDS